MSSPQETDGSFVARLKYRLARATALGPRDLWWKLLDLFDSRRGLRLGFYATVILGVLTVAAVFWVYPWWRQRTSISMAQQWIAAGRFDQAARAVQQAIEVAPLSPEPWKLAGDLARRVGNSSSALTYSRQAAKLAPTDAFIVLTWSADALIAGQSEEAERALAELTATQLEESAHAHRIAGELARRRMQLNEARTHFETALRIEGPDTAINEVPLGTLLLNARDPGERQQGIHLLSKWAGDTEWGANVLRTLLNDALIRNDHAAMLRWAGALRAHPRCTLGDIPQCLLALSEADEARFSEVLVILKKSYSKDTPNIAMLAGWLNQIGRSKEALDWTRTLPRSLTQRAPALVVIAETLRCTNAWNELAEWTARPPWDGSLEFIHLIYRMEAALQLGHEYEAREIQKALETKTPGNGGQAIFAASTLYAWGRRDPAVTLLWLAADQPGSAVEALGTLARHYQEQRDGTGQYRVFRRLRALRTEDDAVANNFAFFATLIGQDLIAAEEIAARNFQNAPDNWIWRSTHAFVLLKKNRAQEALEAMKPVASQWQASPPIAFVYGLVLAANGQKAEARTILATLPTASLTVEEVQLVKTATN